MPNTTAVIVALPSAVDPIRLVGDEEKHATLLFLGETASLPAEAKTNIMEMLATASTLLSPFSESITNIGRLGPGTPPALVAGLSRKNLTQIRDALQFNPSVVSYMNNSKQFNSFTPHVTLGYPDWTEGEQLTKMVSPLYQIQFDRLGLWWNDERFEYNLGDDSGGSLQMKMSVGDFLAHHGIKGMKWGIRRSAKELDSGAGRSADSHPSTGKMATGSVITKKAEDGSVKTLRKKADGSWEETDISADAERFVKTRMKAGHEMSDLELRNALNRAQMMKQYDEFFSDKPNADLQRKVNELQLHKQYRELNAQLNPPKRTAVQKFIGATSKSYDAFTKLDKVTGGALSAQVGGKLTKAFDPEGFASKTAKELETESLNSRKARAQVDKAVAEAKLAKIKVKEKRKP